jgi:hypothetical protein
VPEQAWELQFAETVDWSARSDYANHVEMPYQARNQSMINFSDFLYQTLLMFRSVAGPSLMLMLIMGGSWADGQEPGKKDQKAGKESVMSSELEQFDRRWNRAWLEKDAATVERMMAKDYVYVAPNGQVYDREAILRIIRSPSYRLHHDTLTNVVVRMLGDNAAVIRDRYKGEGELEGKRFKDDHSCIRVCARVQGEWQIVAEQCTENKP